jgi:hypothetical protein
MDPDQMGGVPGCSVEHYIIKMVHFILGSMDGDSDAAVVAVPVDYSKAFNRMLHSNIITIMSDLRPAIPTCAIRLIKSYLTKRSMCVRYKQAVSSFDMCPGGGPQGGLLTGLLFCLQVRRAGSPCLQIGMELPGLEEEQDSAPGMEDGVEGEQDPAPGMEDGVEGEQDPAPGREDGVEGEQDPAHRMEPKNLPLCHNKAKTHKKAFIDDLTLLEKISLSNLEIQEPIVGPPPFHGRFHLGLPENKSILQHQLNDLVVYTKNNHMILNSKKTKCLPFINSHTKDFIPQLSVAPGTNLEVIYQLKLVGLVINSEMTWDDHVDYTIGRVNKTLWQLTRFKQLVSDKKRLITFYILKVRSILMFGAVCFHSALTQEQSKRLELQQKRSLAIILGSDYQNYKNALLLTSLPRLDTLMGEACLQWAIKA